MLNYGHTGPVRFITSVDIPKQSSLQANDNTTVRELTKNQLRTVVISGGEGYDEYRPLSTVTSGTSLSNIGVSNSNSNANANQNDTQNLSNSPLSGGNVINSGSPSNSMNMANMSASMSSNLDENNLGKEDLVNYVLTWELWYFIVDVVVVVVNPVALSTIYPCVANQSTKHLNYDSMSNKSY